MTIFTVLFSKVSRTFWLVLGGVATVLALLAKAYRRGEQNKELEQKERDYEAHKLRADVAEEVSAMSDADVLDKLREHVSKRDE